MPLASDVNIEDLAARAEGFTGADIESVCKKATLLAIAEFRAQAATAPFAVGRKYFEAVLDTSQDTKDTTDTKDTKDRP